MPTFKPLRSELTQGVSPIWGETTLVEDAGGYVLKTPFHTTFPEGTEVSTDFTLADLRGGECVVAGHTTRGAWEMGVFFSASPGRYLNFDGSQHGSLLWNNLCLIRGPQADMIIARHKAKLRYFEKLSKKLKGTDEPCGTPPVSDDEGEGYLMPPPMKRTDSGTSYGFTGFPDVEFWARSGIVADAFVPAEVYQDGIEGMDPEYAKDFYQRGISQLRQMNGSGISAAMQAAINKQAGHYTKKLEELLC
jgi:hypothetical protein